MKTIVAVLALVLCAKAPMAQGQVTPADVPVLLDLVVARMDNQPRLQDSRAAAAEISVDPTSLTAFQKMVPGLTALPRQGRGYRVRPEREVTRGALLTIKHFEPGEKPGEYHIRVDPTLQGRRGDIVIFTVTKKDGEWRVIDGLVLVE